MSLISPKMNLNMRYQGQMPKLGHILDKFGIANPYRSCRVSCNAANPGCKLPIKGEYRSFRHFQYGFIEKNRFFLNGPKRGTLWSWAAAFMTLSSSEDFEPAQLYIYIESYHHHGLLEVAFWLLGSQNNKNMVKLVLKRK